MGKDSYPGGKGQVVRWLINEIPPHGRFVLLFLGHCAVMRHKRAAAVNYHHLGADFRERQNIKRKQARWLANLARVDRLERLAMMEVIERSFADFTKE